MEKSIELRPVDGSSLIKADGYDPDDCKLRVQFHNGEIYEYAGVDCVTHQEYQSAESKGKYFSRVIKPHIQARKLT